MHRHRHRHPLSSVLVGSLYILSTREQQERGRKVVSRFADETRERDERTRRREVEKSAKGTGIINARVSLTSVGQKSSGGPCPAIERPPCTHRHGS